MSLIDMLFKDPTITAQQKVVALLQVHGAGLLTAAEVRTYLLGAKGMVVENCVIKPPSGGGHAVTSL